LVTDSSNVVVVSDIDGIIVGSTITADGIPSGTSVTNIDGLNVTISKTASLYFSTLSQNIVFQYLNIRILSVLLNQMNPHFR
jgi:hypothetical protein